MKKSYLFILVSLTSSIASIDFSQLLAQNSSPYWSLAGNSNASTSSKLGTTNSIPVRILTKNTERVRVDTFGNVGIGTTTIASRLTTNSATNNSPFRALINNSTKFIVGGNGRVGIGNSSPAAILDITGGNNSDLVNTEGDVRIGNSSYRLKIGVTTSGTSAGDVKMRAIGGTSRLILGPNNALTLASNGSIGIGQTNPAAYNSLEIINTYSIGGNGISTTGTFAGIYASGTTYGVQTYSTDGNAVRGDSENGDAGAFVSTNGTGLFAATLAGTYAGDFGGDVHCNGTFSSSDKNIKKNINEVHDALSLFTPASAERNSLWITCTRCRRSVTEFS